VKCFKISNGSTIGFVADYIEWLICSQELVQHVSKIGLLLANSNIYFIIAACRVDCESVQRITNGMIPILKLQLTLENC
jgi:hypothetical protein